MASKVNGLSTIARLQLAMKRHAALHDDHSKPSMRETTPPPSATRHKLDQQVNKSTSKPAPSSKSSNNNATNSVAALAGQLETLWHHQKDGQSDHNLLHPHRHQRQRTGDVAVNQENDGSDGGKDDDDEGEVVGSHQRPYVASSTLFAASSSLGNTLLKIGSDEKDELLVHLLQQVTFYRAQLNEVATLGEKISAQLVHQQHELRLKHREQVESLEQQLHEAVHFHPRVLRLEEKVEQLEESNREKDQQLRFAVQKLQRSRRREKELKTMQDPLWDL